MLSKAVSVIMAVLMFSSTADISGTVFGVDAQMLGVASTSEGVAENTENNSDEAKEEAKNTSDTSETKDNTENKSNFDSESPKEQELIEHKYFGESYLGLDEVVKFSSPLIKADGPENKVIEIRFSRYGNNTSILQITGKVLKYTDENAGIIGTQVRIELRSDITADGNPIGDLAKQQISYPVYKSILGPKNQFIERVELNNQAFEGIKGGNYFVFVYFDGVSYPMSREMRRVNIDNTVPEVNSIEISPYTNSDPSNKAVRNADGTYDYMKATVNVSDNFLLSQGTLSLKVATNNNENINFSKDYSIEARQNTFTVNSDEAVQILAVTDIDNDGKKYSFEFIIESEKIDASATGFIVAIKLYDNVGLKSSEKSEKYFDLDYMYTADVGTDDIYIANRNVDKAVSVNLNDPTNKNSIELKDISLNNNSHVNPGQYWSLQRDNTTIRNEKTEDEFFCYNLISNITADKKLYLSSVEKQPESYDNTKLFSSSVFDNFTNSIMYNGHKYVLYPISHVRKQGDYGFDNTANCLSVVLSEFYTVDQAPFYQAYDSLSVWERAYAYCRAVGGHLVSFETREEWEYVAKELLVSNSEKISAYTSATRYYNPKGATPENNDWIWLTGTDPTTSEKLNKGSDGKFKFSDGTDIPFLDDVFPNTTHYQYVTNTYNGVRGSLENCKWNDWYGTGQEINYFICEIDNVQSFYNGRRYVYYPTGADGTVTTWRVAKEFCEQIGGHLATITSEEEWFHIKDTLLEPNNYPQVFLGGYLDNANIKNEVGIEPSINPITKQPYEVKDQKWTWVTGEEWTYGAVKFDENNDVITGQYPWSPGDPDIIQNGNSYESYLGVQNETFTYDRYDICDWNDYLYNHNMIAGFICEFENFESNFDGNSYVMVTSTMSWTEAKKFCEDNGGHLATIGSESEWNSIKTNLLARYKNINCWLGGYREGDVWKWVKNEEWTADDFGYPGNNNNSPWNVGEPNNSGGSEYCLGTANGGWNDYAETSQSIRGFVCEFEYKFNNFVRSEFEAVETNNPQKFLFYKAPSGEGVAPGVGECYYIRALDDPTTLLSIWFREGKFELYGSIYQKFTADNVNNDADTFKFSLVRKIEEDLYDDFLYKNLLIKDYGEGVVNDKYQTAKERRSKWFSEGRFTANEYSASIFFDYYAYDKYNPTLKQELYDNNNPNGASYCSITGNTLTYQYKQYLDYIHNGIFSGLRASPIFDAKYFIRYYTNIKEAYDKAEASGRNGYETIVKYFIGKFYDSNSSDYFVETADDFSVVAYRKYNPEAMLKDIDPAITGDTRCVAVSDFLRHYWANSYTAFSDEAKTVRNAQDRIYNYVSNYLPNFNLEFTYNSKIQGDNTKYVVQGQFADDDSDMDTSQLFETVKNESYAKLSKVLTNDGNSFVHPTAKLVSKKIPYIENVSDELKWEIAPEITDANRTNRVINKDTLVKVISPNINTTRYVVVTALKDKDSNQFFDPNKGFVQIKYGHTVTKENMKSPAGTGYIYTADAENEQGVQFSYWGVYEPKEINHNIVAGEEIAKCYDKNFSLAVFDDVVIVPIYNGYAQSSEYSTSLQYLGTGRNQWTGTRDPQTGEYIPNSSGVFVPVDKVFSNFLLTFTHKDNMLNTIPVDANGMGKYVKCGVLLEVCGDAKVDSQGNFVTDASKYTSADGAQYDYNDAYKQKIEQLIISDKAKGFTTKNLTNQLNGTTSTAVINYAVSTSKLDNKNKLEYFIAFNNSANNQKKLMRAYTYMVVDGNYDGNFDFNNPSDFVVVCDNPYEFVSYYGVGNTSYL